MLRKISLFISLLIMVASGCTNDAQKIDNLVGHITNSGIELNEPSGDASDAMKGFESVVSFSGGGIRPNVKFLECEDKTLLTIYRFENEKGAQRMKEIIEEQIRNRKTPARVASLIGKQEAKQVNNFVVVVQFKENQIATRNAVMESLGSYSN